MQRELTSSKAELHEAHKARRARLWFAKPPPQKPVEQPAVRVVAHVLPKKASAPVQNKRYDYHVWLYHVWAYGMEKSAVKKNEKIAKADESLCYVAPALYVSPEPEVEIYIAPPRRTMRMIAEEVLHDYPDMTMAIIAGPRRDRQAVKARSMVCYRIKKEQPERSYPEIGRFLGRDHTTVYHAVVRMMAELEGDPEAIANISDKSAQAKASRARCMARRCRMPRVSIIDGVET